MRWTAMQRVRWTLAAALALSCGGDERSGRQAREQAPPPPPSDVLLEQAGDLSATDASDARGRYDRFFVDVAARERVVVTLTSQAFDPILEVTPPGSGALVNDDFEGDTTRSQIELVAPSAGSMKVEVRAYQPDGRGAYSLAVRRVAGADVPVLAIGQSHDGELADGDAAFGGGELFDALVVRTEGPATLTVGAAGGTAPRSTVVGPSGLALTASDGVYHAATAGTYRLQVIGPAATRYRVEVRAASAEGPAQLARDHHRFDTAQGFNASQRGDPGAQGTPPQALVVRVGDRLDGNLAATDPRLPTGEHYDVYELTVAGPQDAVAIEMESTSLDCFLRVDGPGGQHWENDDHGGSLNSRVEVPLSRAGVYRIVATSYRAGETGRYELKVLGMRDVAAAQAGGAQRPGEQQITGQLRRGDQTLRSGEYFDEHRFRWPAGSRVHLEARSDDFDTYLIVHPPSGPQQDNDDMVPGQTTNAGLDLQVAEAGEYRVLVTSYRPGETGDYALVVTGAGGAPSPSPTPAPAPTPAPTAGSSRHTGTLAAGDGTLRTGEFADVYTLSFTPRSAVRIRLESSAFDTYLIVRSPSGNQEDNDDIEPGVLNSGIDIPVAEPGAYQVTVTSYRPGETGAYVLTVTEGPSVVAPAPRPDGTPPASGGGRVWGLFAGITDYPGTGDDLPECANDARKLAEAVRNQGNMPRDQEFLFVDGQATTASVRSAMQTIAQRIRPDDVLVFFYSGHGGQTGQSTDTREIDGRDEYLVLHDGQMMDDELGRLFDAVRARVSLVAIDACFAGGFAKDIITRPGRVGMFSSEEDVTSAVADRFQAGGYLSHFLRLGMQGEADNDPRNHILTVGELTHYTWVQFGRHASDVRMSMGYQHLVVDRGAVRTSEVLWAVQR